MPPLQGSPPKEERAQAKRKHPSGKAKYALKVRLLQRLPELPLQGLESALAHLGRAGQLSSGKRKGGKGRTVCNVAAGWGSKAIFLDLQTLCVTPTSLFSMSNPGPSHPGPRPRSTHHGPRSTHGAHRRGLPPRRVPRGRWQPQRRGAWGICKGEARLIWPSRGRGLLCLPPPRGLTPLIVMAKCFPPLRPKETAACEPNQALTC